MMVMSPDQSIIILSTLFWFYIDTVKIFKNDKIINSALIHSIFAASYTNLACMMYPQLIYDYHSVEPELPSWTTVSLLITHGYGYRDLYFGIKSRKLDDLAHGIIFLVGYSYARSTSMTLLLLGFITETSSIFLNLRPLQNIVLDGLFVITFFVYRFIVLSLFIYYYLTNPDSLYKHAVLMSWTPLTILNIYWFNLISKKAIRVYKTKYTNV